MHLQSTWMHSFALCCSAGNLAAACGASAAASVHTWGCGGPTASQANSGDPTAPSLLQLLEMLKFTPRIFLSISVMFCTLQRDLTVGKFVAVSFLPQPGKAGRVVVWVLCFLAGSFKQMWKFPALLVPPHSPCSSCQELLVTVYHLYCDGLKEYRLIGRWWRAACQAKLWLGSTPYWSNEIPIPASSSIKQMSAHIVLMW